MKSIENNKLVEALNWRFAVNEFDTLKKVSEDDINTILESARLAPSSFGIEPWKFVVVKNKEVREKLRAAGYDQPKITDASHLVVITYRTDKENLSQELIKRKSLATGKVESDLEGLKGMVDGTISSKSDDEFISWSKAQTYIPLGIMVETASLLAVDSGPMEGFEPSKVDEILGLKEKNLSAATMIVFGYRGEDDGALVPKTRRPFDEAVEVVE